MNWLPFVSRDRFEEKSAEVRELRSELAHERERNSRLYNWFIWRLGGVAPDVSQLPEVYQPKVTPTPVDKPEATAGQQPQRRRPGQARFDIANFEADRELELMTGGARITRMPDAQKAVIIGLNDAANDGIKAATGG